MGASHLNLSAHAHRGELIGSRGVCGVLAVFVCWQISKHEGYEKGPRKEAQIQVVW